MYARRTCSFFLAKNAIHARMDASIFTTYEAINKNKTNVPTDFISCSWQLY